MSQLFTKTGASAAPRLLHPTSHETQSLLPESYLWNPASLFVFIATAALFEALTTHVFPLPSVGTTDITKFEIPARRWKGLCTGAPSSFWGYFSPLPSHPTQSGLPAQEPATSFLGELTHSHCSLLLLTLPFQPQTASAPPRLRPRLIPCQSKPPPPTETFSDP